MDELEKSFKLISNKIYAVYSDNIMIIDLETTGLPKGRSLDYKDNKIFDSSRIVQASWIICSPDSRLLKIRDFIIKPNGFKISPAVTKIHGISHKHAVKHGTDIKNMFNVFKKDLGITKFMVAHNASFDITIIKNELYRRRDIDTIKMMDDRKVICTKETTVNLCKIKLYGKYKYPKLEELHQFCFGKKFENAHNAVADILATANCFFYVRNKYELYKDTYRIKPNAKLKPIDKAYDFLNDEQKKVVFEDLDKNILIIACAGSGKTTTILYRIKHLIESGVPPHQIVLTTFTRDAANDMKKKLTDIVGDDVGIEVGTIDSISLRNVNKYAREMLKGSVRSVSEYGYLFSKFLEKHSNRMKYLSDKKYLFVDEYQDINNIQFSIIKSFYDSGTKITAVGDDAQNIYSFRDANIEYIFKFMDQFKNTVKHTLTTNYRSTPEIIDLANNSIEHNKLQMPKKMTPHNKSIGVKPTIDFFYSYDQQFRSIADKIKYYIAKGIELHEIAVLSPFNTPLFKLEESLTKENIPHVVLDGKGDIRIKVKENHVCLSTIHKSKGLEWKAVFIINMNDDSFPAKKNKLDIEESRRLFYVAVTRAKQYLHMMFTPGYCTKYMTRYLSELDKNLYKFPKYDSKFVGLATTEASNYELSVTELINNLDGSDHIKLKYMNIVPQFEWTRMKLHDDYEYKDFIKENDIYSDFGIYIDCLISRMIGGIDNKSGGLYDKSALYAIANIRVDANEWVVYRNYQLNFIENIHLVDTIDDNTISLLETHCDKYSYIQRINRANEKYILNIAEKIINNSKKYNIPKQHVPVFPERFLPQEFEILMGKDLKKYSDKKEKWNSNVTWEISKCNKIVNDKRRRLLYKDIDKKDLDQYDDLYSDIEKNFVELIKDKEKICHHYVKLDEDGVYGDMDLIIDDAVLDYKVSNRKDIQGEWVLQLLCYVHLCRYQDMKINKIQVYNPLQGTLYTADVSKWNKGNVLIKYLLNKRTQLIMRTSAIQDKQDAEVDGYEIDMFGDSSDDE